MSRVGARTHRVTPHARAWPKCPVAIGLLTRPPRRACRSGAARMLLQASPPPPPPPQAKASCAKGSLCYTQVYFFMGLVIAFMLLTILCCGLCCMGAIDAPSKWEEVKAE